LKIITALAADHLEGQFTEPHGILQQVLDEPLPGYFRAVKLSAAAVVIQRGPHAVVIPLDVLRRMADTVEPALVPTPPPHPVEPMPIVAT
jgi:hypothetical protein